MKFKALITFVLLTLLTTGCSVHWPGTRQLSDFTAISSKTTQLQIPTEAMGPRVEGVDKVWYVLVPFGKPNIEEAIDQAIESAGPGYDALIDGELYKTFPLFVIGKIGYKIVGTPVKTNLLSASPSNSGNPTSPHQGNVTKISIKDLIDSPETYLDKEVEIYGDIYMIDMAGGGVIGKSVIFSVSPPDADSVELLTCEFARDEPPPPTLREGDYVRIRGRVDIVAAIPVLRECQVLD